ncbi:hypothetical protein ACHAW6_002735 [Cyclotella cf. meneghiniana]
MRKPNFRSVVFSLAFMLSKVSALQLRETQYSLINERRTSCLAFARPFHKRSASTTFINHKKEQPSPMVLNYRNTSYDDDIKSHELYTDRLWQSALVADSLHLELKPVHDAVSSRYRQSSDEFIETAKAFIPVVIEISVVAAVASTVSPIN